MVHFHIQGTEFAEGLRVCLLGDGVAHPSGVCLGPKKAGLSSGRGFERGTQFEDFLEVASIERDDARAAIGLKLQETFGG